MSVRIAAQRLGVPPRQVEEMENESQDLPVSMLYRWANALRVPVHEVLLDNDLEGISSLSPLLRDRANMVRIMKTLESIRAEAEGTGVRRQIENLRTQLLEIMPELDSITPWPQFGYKRGYDDFGRIAIQTVPDPTADELD
jgi:hypothetical protein